MHDKRDLSSALSATPQPIGHPRHPRPLRRRRVRAMTCQGFPAAPARPLPAMAARLPERLPGPPAAFRGFLQKIQSSAQR
jgi:hypothetical protein